MLNSLTICQPFAALICLPESDERHKRAENRTWATPYRGPLAIHAGKSREWYDAEELAEPWPHGYGMTEADLVFGAVVGVAELVTCLPIDAIHEGQFVGRFPWLKDHYHVEGPVCWILANVRPLARPVPCKGERGLFVLPPDVEAAAWAQLDFTPRWWRPSDPCPPENWGCSGLDDKDERSIRP